MPKRILGNLKIQRKSNVILIQLVFWVCYKPQSRRDAKSLQHTIVNFFALCVFAVQLMILRFQRQQHAL